MSGSFEAPMTRHAETRSRQRGIREEAMEVLLAHGTSRIGPQGREVVFMNKAARANARAALGRTLYAQLERALDIYLVLTGDGKVLTCCYRNKKLRFLKN